MFGSAFCVWGEGSLACGELAADVDDSASLLWFVCMNLGFKKEVAKLCSPWKLESGIFA